MYGAFAKKNHAIVDLLNEDMRKKSTFNLVFYGDSWTLGGWSDSFIKSWGDDSTSFTGKLKTLMQSRNINCTVINSGTSGWNSGDALTNIASKVLAYSPKYCILNFGVNDWADWVTATPPPFNNSVALATYITNMQSIITQLKAINCNIILWVSGPITNSENKWGYSDYFNDLSAVNRFTAYQDALKNLATTNDLPIVDSYGAIAQYYKLGDNITPWFYNKAHLKQGGLDIIYSSLVKTLFPLRIIGSPI